MLRSFVGYGIFRNVYLTGSPGIPVSCREILRLGKDPEPENEKGNKEDEILSLS